MLKEKIAVTQEKHSITNTNSLLHAAKEQTAHVTLCQHKTICT